VRKLRRGRIAALIVVLILLAAAGVLAWLSTTSFVHARTLQVEGNHHLSDAAVLAVAGLTHDTDVARLDQSAVIARLLKDPWIRAATVTSTLPSTVLVTIEERTPTAAVEGRAVAADGTILPGAAVEGLPVIRASVGGFREGEWAGAAGALSELPGGLRASIQVALVQPDGVIWLVVGDGPDVVWGEPGLTHQKVAALRAVNRWATEQHVTLARVDVSVPSAPAATLVNGSTVSL
jgi:cell division protein FtsQ